MLKTQESREVVQLMTRKSDKNERGIRTRKVKRTVEAAYLGHPKVKRTVEAAYLGHPEAEDAHMQDICAVVIVSSKLG
ncbi:hypothetical protein QE152_g4762 [Popillia japonica]|uniref:Uncharacterized protein n=1 Tax=Popillia japonica TaxID=7064 RepID=A0AAW1MZK7_POPJA